MTDLRKAAEMALNVLRQTAGYSNESQTRIDDAKHALVQALAQPEQEPVAWIDRDGNVISFHHYHLILDKASLKPLYTYPVTKATITVKESDEYENEARPNITIGKTKQALRQALNVDKVYMSEKRVHKSDKCIHEWVGLTEDEFESILEQHNEAFPFAVYESIEAKLKEKNT